MSVFAELFARGKKHFDEKEYFEAHEVWEELWNELSGPRRSYIQGLIQVAVALHHAGNGNFRGARKLFATAFNHLEKGKMEAREVDLDELRERVISFQLSVDALSGDMTPALPYFKLPMRQVADE